MTLPPRIGRLLRGALLAAALAAVPGTGQAATLFGLVDTGELFTSSDLGVTWRPAGVLPVHDAAALVAGASSSDLYLASASGSVFRSLNAGSTWTAVGALPASGVVAIGSLAWITVAVIGRKYWNWSADLAATLAALPPIILLLPFLPGVVMADGMKSLNILAGVEALMLGIILPAVDGLLVRRKVILK